MSTTFSSLGLPPDLCAHLEGLGLEAPFPVQSATLEDSLAGRDVCAQSPTGSGKTIAFGLPLVARTSKGKPRSPRALVLAPTRELASQIGRVLEDLGRPRGRRVSVFYGGTGYGEQLRALRAGVDIAVACPGRLLDLATRGDIDLGSVDIVVVDEADRMADMGFLPDVKRILDQVRPERQTLLFSATMSSEVEKLVARYQRQPARTVVEGNQRTSGSRQHEFWRTPKDQRGTTAASLVAGHYSSIVFCRTRRGVDRLTRHLAQAGIAAVAIHGDRSQSQRERALAMFRSGHVQVLVGTDVASRGLHIEGVDCVVHYDPPEDDDTYVHRSGRTGRAGSEGLVISLVSTDQESAARKLQQRLSLKPGFAEPAFRPGVVLSPAPAAPQAAGRTAKGERPSAVTASGHAQPAGRRAGSRSRAGGRSFDKPRRTEAKPAEQGHATGTKRPRKPGWGGPAVAAAGARRRSGHSFQG